MISSKLEEHCDVHVSIPRQASLQVKSLEGLITVSSIQSQSLSSLLAALGVGILG